MIHETNNKDSTKIRTKLDKEDISILPQKINNNKMTGVMTPQRNTDSYLKERAEETTTTKNKGVWYNARTRCWLTCVKGTGRHLRVFSVKKYGYKQAKMLALECKSAMYTNDDELLKKQESKEEVQNDQKSERMVKQRSSGPQNGILNKNGVTSGKKESGSGKSEKGNLQIGNETWKGEERYNSQYFDNIGSASTTNNSSVYTNTNRSVNGGNNFNDYSSDSVYQTGKDSYYTNSVEENNVEGEYGNGKEKSNGDIFGNGNNENSNHGSRRGIKRGIKNGNKDSYLWEAKIINGKSAEFLESFPSNTCDMNADAESRDTGDLQRDAYNDTDWTNRRYNTRRGNQVLGNEVKGLKRNNASNTNSSRYNHSEATTCSASRNGDIALNVLSHMNNGNSLKKRKRTLFRYGKNDMPDDYDESENENEESEKGGAVMTNHTNHNDSGNNNNNKNVDTKNCLITAEDFHLDSPESTDNEHFFFNSFSSETSQPRNEKQKKIYKHTENEMNYIFTNEYYSDNRSKSKQIQSKSNENIFPNPSNSSTNVHDMEEENLLINNENSSSWVPISNVPTDNQNCNPAGCASNMNDVEQVNTNTNNTVQDSSNSGNSTGESGYNRNNSIKKSSKKKLSSFKSSFLDLTREALILILKDLKFNVVPQLETIKEKKERYANVLRLCLRNAKYTKHFNELEPYLNLFGECIRNSRLPSSMQIEEQMFYLDKL